MVLSIHIYLIHSSLKHDFTATSSMASASIFSNVDLSK